MALLDSLLALALTLAALATVATVILEIAFRSLRLKRIGQLRMAEKLIDQATGLRDGTAEKPAATAGARTARLLANPFAVNLWGFCRNLWIYWRKCSAFYDDISLEHTLRRLVDIVGEPARGAADAAREIGEKLEALGVSYDEYCSALAARYKQNAQRWSLVVGVLLALGMNVNGFRVLEVYLQDPELRQRAIEQLRQDETTPAPAAVEERDTDRQLQELQQKYDHLRGQVAVITGLDLPIGWSYFPSCLRHNDAGEIVPSADPRCPEAGETGWDLESGTFWSWLAQVLVTGLLIGLGAPFWYDLARRLAEVRTAFGGKGTAEQQHRGDDGRNGPWARRRLVQRVVQDFLALGRQAETPGADKPRPQES